MDFMGLLQGLSTKIRPMYMIIQSLNCYISFNYQHKKIGFEQKMCFFRRLLVCSLVALLEILIVDLVISIRRVIKHTLRNTFTLLAFSIPFQLQLSASQRNQRPEQESEQKRNRFLSQPYKRISLQVHIVQISFNDTAPFVRCHLLCNFACICGILIVCNNFFSSLHMNNAALKTTVEAQ